MLRPILLALILLAPLALAMAPSDRVFGQSPPDTILSELVGERSRNGKVFEDLLNPESRRLVSSLAPLHYESVPGIGVWDREIDLRPVRVVNASFDGWVVTANGWHYRLGNLTEHGTDGWVGFGGRQGQNWFDFRLESSLYLHYPTRTPDFLGTATYDRADLTRTPQSVEIGSSSLVPSLKASWLDLARTPGGGRLSIDWLASGFGIKEDVRLNEAALTWIRQNRPPTTPASETYFGYLFRLDLDDVPFVVRNGTVVDKTSDFDDNETATLELRDALGRLLALLPIETGRTENATGVLGTVGLRKRIWTNATGSFMLLGARVDRLASLPVGDLVFDPTLSAQVGAGADDTETGNPPPAFSATRTIIEAPGESDTPEPDDVSDASFRFTDIQLAQGTNVTGARIRPFTVSHPKDGAGVLTEIHLEASDNPLAPTSFSDFQGRTLTTNFTNWDGQDFSTARQTSPDIGPVVGEVLNRTGWQAGNSLQVFWIDNGSTAERWYKVRAFEFAPADAMIIEIDFVTEVPTVVTLTIAGATKTTAALRGNLTDTGTNAFVLLSFEFGLAPASLTNETPILNVTTTQTFSILADGLEEDTTYFYRAKALGAGNETPGFGVVLSFTTEAEALATEDVVLIVGLVVVLSLLVVGLVFGRNSPLGAVLWIFGGIVGILLGLFLLSTTSEILLWVATAGLGLIMLGVGFVGVIEEALP